MSPVRFRPDVKLPWQAIALFAAAAYVVRSAVRGWDFMPELLDVLVFGALAVILIVRPLLARSFKDREEDDGS